MAVIKIEEVLTCSPSHGHNTLQNLVQGRSKWTSPKGANVRTLECEVKIPRSHIHNVDVGNYWSSSIQIQVGRSGDPKSERHVLLFTKILMTRLDAQNDKNSKGMHFFTKQDFNPEVADKTWDILKMTCTQPFRREIFGLATWVIRGQALEIGRRSNENVPAAPLSSLPGSGQLLLDKALGHLSKPKLTAKEAFVFRRKVQSFLFSLQTTNEKGSFKEILELWYRKNSGLLRKEEKEVLEDSIVKYLQETPAVRSSASKKRPLSESMEHLRGSDDFTRNRGEKEKPKQSRNYRDAFAIQDVAQPGEYKKIYHTYPVSY